MFANIPCCPFKVKRERLRTYLNYTQSSFSKKEYHTWDACISAESKILLMRMFADVAWSTTQCRNALHQYTKLCLELWRTCPGRVGVLKSDPFRLSNDFSNQRTAATVFPGVTFLHSLLELTRLTSELRNKRESSKKSSL